MTTRNTILKLSADASPKRAFAGMTTPPVSASSIINAAAENESNEKTMKFFIKSEDAERLKIIEYAIASCLITTPEFIATGIDKFARKLMGSSHSQYYRHRIFVTIGSIAMEMSDCRIVMKARSTLGSISLYRHDEADTRYTRPLRVERSFIEMNASLFMLNGRSEGTFNFEDAFEYITMSEHEQIRSDLMKIQEALMVSTNVNNERYCNFTALIQKYASSMDNIKVLLDGVTNVLRSIDTKQAEAGEANTNIAGMLKAELESVKMIKSEIGALIKSSVAFNSTIESRFNVSKDEYKSVLMEVDKKYARKSGTMYAKMKDLLESISRKAERIEALDLSVSENLLAKVKDSAESNKMLLKDIKSTMKIVGKGALSASSKNKQLTELMKAADELRKQFSAMMEVFAAANKSVPAFLNEVMSTQRQIAERLTEITRPVDLTPVRAVCRTDNMVLFGVENIRAESIRIAAIAAGGYKFNIVQEKEK
jgi:uncharacterized coiled-coil DUF342 family protein